MPELPDIVVYLDALERRISGVELARIRIANPFLVRTVEPPLTAVEGRRVIALRRIGKRIAIGFEGDLWIVMHLMIAGRLHWSDKPGKLPAKRGLAAFDFATGSLTLTEAGSARRASLYVAAGSDGLAAHDPGGLEPLECSFEQFMAAVQRGNHTLKRVLTDPRTFSGVGNAFSDEILHRARLSPVALSRRLDDDSLRRLFDATRAVLLEWLERLREQTGDGFPENVTAFRPEMAVHGRFGQPCPDCGAAVQRIRYAANETNYCARCQTGGRLLADRSLSRLLKNDWPRSIDDVE